MSSAAYVAIGRNPFGRYDIVRETVPAHDQKPCTNCLSRGGRFVYGRHDDSGRRYMQSKAFCSVGCMRQFYGEDAGK